MFLGFVLHEQGRSKEAEAAYRSAIRCKPDQAVAVAVYFKLGLLLHRGGRAEEAIAAYRMVIQLENHAPAYNNLGLLYRDAGDLDKAIATWHQGAAFGPGDSAAINFVWHVSRFPGRPQDECEYAVSIAKRLVDNNPSRANLRSNLGVAQYRNGQWQLAVETLKKAREMRGDDDPDHQFFLAMALWRLGEKGHAQALFREAVFRLERQQKPSVEQLAFRSEAETLFGLSLTNEDRRQIALEYASGQLEDNPDDTKLLLWRGNEYIKLGRHKEAKADFLRLVTLTPNDQVAHLRLSLAAMHLLDYGTVIEECNAAIQIGPEIAAPYGRRGDAYARMGKIEQAKADFAAAIKLNPHGFAHRARGEMHAGQGDWQEALDDFREFHQRHPTDQRVRHKIALLLLAIGDNDGYRRWCEELVKQHRQKPGPETGRALLECALLAPGVPADKSTLLGLAEAEVARHPESRAALVHLSAARLRAGETEAAMSHLESISEPKAKRTLEMCWLALAQLHAGKSEKAQGALDVVDEWLKSQSGAYWANRLEIVLLRQEAVRLIESRGTAGAPNGRMPSNKRNRGSSQAGSTEKTAGE